MRKGMGRNCIDRDKKEYAKNFSRSQSLYRAFDIALHNLCNYIVNHDRTFTPSSYSSSYTSSIALRIPWKRIPHLHPSLGLLELSSPSASPRGTDSPDCSVTRVRGMRPGKAE